MYKFTSLFNFSALLKQLWINLPISRWKGIIHRRLFPCSSLLSPIRARKWNKTEIVLIIINFSGDYPFCRRKPIKKWQFESGQVNKKCLCENVSKYLDWTNKHIIMELVLFIISIHSHNLVSQIYVYWCDFMGI